MTTARMIVPAFVLGFGAVGMLAFQPADKQTEKPAESPTTPTNPTTPTPTPAVTPAQPKSEGSKVKTPDGKEYTVLATTEIKLLIEDLKLGDGAEAKPSSTISIQYHGTLAKDGKKFDGNWGEDVATFPLNRLIQGWQMGIPGMKVGGIRKLTIPWQLAYGDRGSGPIPAKADLVFLIELKDVK